MGKITVGLIYLMLTTQAIAANGGGKVVNVEGASLSEIAGRTENGVGTFYRITSTAFVLIGFFLFAGSIIRLIKITRGEIPNAKPISAFLGMIFAAMLASTGVWMFATKNTLEKTFTK